MSLKGIAITFADNDSCGHWQYSLGGNAWLDIGGVGANAALLLPETARLRFVPDVATLGMPSIQYKAWDRTAGQAGDRVDTKGLLNSFSSEIEAATISVTP
jgi:hypothetical protein